MSKISLRKITKNDANVFYQMVTSSPDIKKYIPGIVFDTYAKNHEYVNYLSSLDFIHDFAFFILKDDQPAGFILANQDRKYFKSLNVDCFCSGKYRRQNIALNGMKLFIDLCNDDGFYTSLLLDIKPSNTASRNLAIKLGAKKTITLDYIGLASFQRYEIKL